MNADQNLENILKIIQNIENKTIDLKNSDEIHKIEMDILLGRVRELYEILLQLDQDYPYTFKKGQKVEFQIKQENQSENKTTENPEEKPLQSIEPEKQEEKEPGEEVSGTEYHEEQQSANKNIQQEKSGKPSASKNKEYGPEIIADKFQNSKTFRHDNLAKNQQKNDVSSKMQTKPIHDLTKAIGVNDKFLFIKELFNGNKERYHEAIQILNNIPTFKEAETYLQESFDWDDEQPETKKFFDLIRRKFK